MPKGTDQSAHLISLFSISAICILMTSIRLFASAKFIISDSIIMHLSRVLPCADPESFVRGGPTTLKTFFLPLKAFHWRANDGPTLNAGLVF